MIEFGEVRTVVGVKKDGELIGFIRLVTDKGGWQFFPRGQEESDCEVYGSLEACKKSLI